MWSVVTSLVGMDRFLIGAPTDLGFSGYFGSSYSMMALYKKTPLR